LTLLEHVCQNKKGAWDRLVSLYTPLVYYWCKQKNLQRANAEDIAQQVFMVVHRKIKDFHHDRQGDTFRGWLKKVTVNKIKDAKPPLGGKGAGGSTAQHDIAEIPEADPDALAQACIEAAEKNIIYKRAIELMEASFEATTWKAFLYMVTGRTARETAAELGISLRAVYTAKARVVRQLRQEFGDLLP
jgi:RNA polymerase sigma-70 factor (ECF subfamily)